MMRRFFAFLFIILMTGIILFPATKTVQFSHISIEHGLSQTCVACIYQDKIGFMWFGTLDGLNRYDGRNIKIYQTNPNDPNSLSDNTVWAICGDKSGDLWIGTGNGLNKFDSVNEKFIRFKNKPGDPNSLSGNDIRSLYVDKSGKTWIGTYLNELNKYDPGTGKFTHYEGPADYPFKSVFAICEDTRGFLWIGTPSGLYRFELANERFVYYKNIPRDANSLSEHSISSLHYDEGSGMLWIASLGGGIVKFDPQKEKAYRYRYDPQAKSSLVSNYIRAVCMDKHNTLWLGTFMGLSRFNLPSEEFFNYKHYPNEPTSLSNDYILSIYEDRSGAIWVGTNGSGLDIYDRKLQKFLVYQHDPNNPNSIHENHVWGFAEDDSGAIWIGTARGIDKFDPEKEIFTHYKDDSTDTTSLSDGDILSICKSRSGKLWLGTSNGLNELDPATGQSFCYKNKPINKDRNDYSSDPLINKLVLSLYEDRNGILWIGTQWGLGKFDPMKKAISHYSITQEFRFDPLNTIHTINEVQPGILWLGTAAGKLFEFNMKIGGNLKSIGRFKYIENLNYTITSMLKDKSGFIWVGTSGGGLHKFKRSKKLVSLLNTYTIKDGLPNNIIHGILEDSQENLWIGTNKGLSRYTRSTNTFRNYRENAGLQSYEFNANSCYKTKNGEMYFGGSKGFNRFFPEKIIDNLYIPPVVITSFKITDRAAGVHGELPLQKEINFKDKVALSYKDNIFSIEFAALDFTAPENNQYKCKLEGFNEDWINLGFKNDITFTNLDPGAYTFRVMGSNNDGYWNAEGASLKIIIKPPFWQTWYFRVLMVIAFCSLLVALHKFRTKRIKQDLEKKRLERELRLKGDFTAMLVHDLRSPLTAIIGYSEMLIDMSDQIDVKKTGQVIHRSSDKMLSLINDMLELSKFEAGKMNLVKKEVDMIGVVKEIVEIMDPLFKRRDIELVCSSTIPGKECKLNVDVEKIGQVLSNLLSNAAKFTPHRGKVIIHTHKTAAGFLQVSVTDNGPGVPQDRLDVLFDKYMQIDKDSKNKGTGLGLAVSKMIIEAHGGEIGYKSAPDGKGSTFFFKLPISTTQEKGKE